MNRPLLVCTIALLAVGCAGRVAPSVVPPVPSSAVVGTLVLIGDAGAPSADDPVLAALTRTLREAPARSSVVFLGDNVYPRGIPDPDAAGYDEAVRRLRVQVDAAGAAGVPTFFVGGNHDWDKHGDSGWAAIRRQTALVASLSGGSAEFLPGNGCPGPVVREVPGFRIVALDSQWWLHGGPRPSGPDDGCTTWDSAGVASALGRVMAAGDRWQSVVVAHHPLESHGEGTHR